MAKVQLGGLVGRTADRLCPRPFIDLARTSTKYKATMYVEAMQSRNQKLHCLVRFEVQTYERRRARIVGVLQLPLDKDQTVTQSDKSQ